MRGAMLAIGTAALIGTVLVVACDSSSGDGGAAAGDGGAPGDDAASIGDGALVDAGPGVTPPPGSATAFCDGTLGVVVRALEACCNPADQNTQLYKLTHGLAAGLEPVCASTLGASIMHARVAFHPDAATACYAAYGSTYAPGKCANITTTFTDPAGTSCRQAFSGLVAAGGACGGDHECVEGLTCVGYTQSEDGMCRAPGAVGDACGRAPSEGGSILDTTSLEFGSHPACAPNAHCLSLTGTQGKCVAAAMSGSTCVEDSDCAAPLLCHLDVCGTTGPAPSGSECKSRSDCAPGLACERPTNANGTCAAKKTAGQACTASAFDSDCVGRCDADGGVGAGSCVTFCGSP